jgi:hypothetical protein
MNNFSPGISPVSSGGGIAPASGFGQGDLLQMLHQLISQRMGVTSAGTNNYTLAPGSLNYGGLDASGKYHAGNYNPYG